MATPLAVIHTGGNRYDVTQLPPLIDAHPAGQRQGRSPATQARLPLRRPRVRHDIYGDQVRQRRTASAIARRGTLHGTGLGTYRWVVERTFAWLHGFKRLRIRWERRAEMYEAFLKLACCLSTRRQINSLC
ncbi:transposase [Streptomyces sp. NPDC091289]|uniref:transposase n=1 Tax=Streptomyces sp. NPDC091289 TaxID=3365989 RepID=UPI00380E9FCF